MKSQFAISSYLLPACICLLVAAHQADSDELLVCGFFSDSVGRYDASTGAFLGNYESGVGLDGPLAARIGSDGLLYVASEGSNQIKRYNVGTRDFVDNFIAAGLGGLNGPSGVTWDGAGDLLVSSFNSDSVLKYDGSTGTFLGIPVTNGSGGVNGPDNGSIIGPDGLLYVPSYWSNQVIRYDLTAQTSEVFISVIGRPRVLVFQGDNLFITSESSDAVRRYALDGTFIDNFIQPGSAILDVPVGLEFHNGSWFVSSVSMHKVLQFDAAGGLVNENFIPAGSGGLNAPVFITAVADSVPQVIAPTSLLVTRGNLASGSVSDLAESDNDDVSIQRNSTDIQSRTEFEVSSSSPSASPTSMEVTLEGSVFARSTVTQVIELFNFDSDGWEQVDSRAASRFSDAEVNVQVTGDVARFVEAATLNIKARIRYQSTNPRQQFSSNSDQFVWTIVQ